MLKTISFRTQQRQELRNLTDDVRAFIHESAFADGLCVVYCPHTTAGITINSYMDPKTSQDIVFEMDRIVPTRIDFFHTVDTPSDAAGHVKSSLIGIHEVLIVHEGELLLGHSQGILFAEFDGPRDRRIFVKLIKSSA